jgi:MazG family protein
MTGSKFNEFVQIVERLRKECPWDKEQTNDSIKAATIEEAYEVVDAIDNKDYDELKKELGDLLLHVVFHTVIAEESNHFKIDDVIDSIQEKIIRRHPHVFGDKEVSGAEEVKTNWEEIKLSEGRTNLLDGMPPLLPALQLAHRIQEKVSKVGFDWARKEEVWKKVVEEIEEMHQSELEGIHDELEGEIGDVIFALVNYARFLRVNPENALRKTNNKFIKRFGYIEEKITESGRKLSESTLEEMDKFWEESKNIVD